MADLVIKNLVRTYGPVRAVDDVSLHVAEGEFLTLLGPSGCGKSTTLAMVAGLDKPDGGLIRVGDRVFFDGAGASFVPPERRNVGMVFQSYALWPHMTVADNLAFPLQLRKIKGEERRRMIADALEIVEMGPYSARYPFELSGGQQQRVALARALVYRPAILLLDEPLSNLDAKLRERARVWLRELQVRLGVTTIYVTHDQSEAMAVSDRIAVMRAGKIAQLDTPEAIYDEPADEFVADFIGSANFLPGTVMGSEGAHARVQLADGSEILTQASRTGGLTDILLAVRPEKIRLEGAPGENRIPVRIESMTYLGSVYQYEVSSGDIRFRVQADRAAAFEQPYAHIPIEAGRVFAKSERAVESVAE